MFHLNVAQSLPSPKATLWLLLAKAMQHRRNTTVPCRHCVLSPRGCKQLQCFLSLSIATASHNVHTTTLPGSEQTQTIATMVSSLQGWGYSSTQS